MSPSKLKRKQNEESSKGSGAVGPHLGLSFTLQGPHIRQWPQEQAGKRVYTRWSATHPSPGLPQLLVTSECTYAHFLRGILFAPLHIYFMVGHTHTFISNSGRIRTLRNQFFLATLYSQATYQILHKGKKLIKRKSIFAPIPRQATTMPIPGRHGNSTIYFKLPKRGDPEGPAKAEGPETGKPSCKMREGALACNSPGIMALADGSRVLIAEGQVVEELPEITQGINIIFKSSVSNT